MDYSADIKTFDALRRGWYEATLSSDDEKRLYALAERLLQAGALKDDDRADAIMLAACACSASCPDAHYKSVDFAATLDRVVTPRRRKAPLLWISAAACAALLAGLGLGLLRPGSDSPAARCPSAPALTAQSSAPAASISAPVPPAASPQVSIPAATPSVATPSVATPGKQKQATRPISRDTVPAEQPALREITDLNEASCLLSHTCLVLGSSLALAQNSASCAITELEINLNCIN